MTESDARRKVGYLKALAAEGSGATEPERATAQRMADDLTTKFKLNDKSSEKTFGEFSETVWNQQYYDAVRSFQEYQRRQQDELIRSFYATYFSEEEKK